MKRPSNSDIVFGLLLFVGALLPRLWVATAFWSEPVWDGQYYDFGAHRIADGFGYSDDRLVAGQHVIHPWCHYPVGYSAVLGFLYWIFGAKHGVAIGFHSVVGALLAVVTWLVATHAMSTFRARIAGVIVAAYPGLILYSALYMTEPFAALATMIAFWLAVRDHDRRRGVLLGALGLGLSALIRPQALLCVPFLVLLLPRARAPIWIARIGVACAIALVPVLPWTARNCAVMDGCALVSTNAGWNLAIGSFPRATGRFETLHSEDGCRDVTGQVQQDRCWFELGMDNIRRSPKRWLGLVPAKLGFTFDHESFPVEYLRQGRPERWPEERRVAWRDFTSTAFRALATFAAIGCIGFARGTTRRRVVVVQGILAAIIGILILYGARSEAPTFWPLVLVCCVVPWLPLPGAPRFPPAMLLPVALLATTAVTHAVFFGEDRYHMVVIPALAILAAGMLRQSRSASKVFGKT